MEWRQFRSVKISEKGDVQSLDPRRYIKARTDANGYVMFSFDGANYFAHRLVAHLWLGLDLDDRCSQVDHKDEVRSNNHWSNLQIVSIGENKRLATMRAYPNDDALMKTCRKCRMLKPSTEFGQDRRREDGRTPYCKSCLKIIRNCRKKPGN